MDNSPKLKRAQKILFILEFIEAIEAAFIIGLIVYLNNVIKLSYMLDIIRIIFVVSTLFLISAIRGIYKYYKNYATELA